MTLYLVKHAPADWRLDRPDGMELQIWSSDPRETDSVTAMFIDAMADVHNGASILGDPQARRDHVNVVAGDWEFRDVNAHGISGVPW